MTFRCEYKSCPKVYIDVLWKVKTIPKVYIDVLWKVKTIIKYVKHLGDLVLTMSSHIVYIYIYLSSFWFLFPDTLELPDSWST